MATQPCPNIAQVTVEMSYDSQKVINDYFFHKASAFVDGNMQSIALAAEGEAITNLAPHYASDVKFERCVATDLTSLAGERAVVSFPPNTYGAKEENSAPANVALALQKQTGNRGKGRQGRLFIGPLPISAVTENTATSVYALEIQAGVEAWLTAMTALLGGIDHVVVHRYEGGNKLPEGLPVPVVGVGFSNLQVDSQALRLPGRKKRKLQTP